MRELVGHAARSLTTVGDYLAAPSPDGAAAGAPVDAIGYFRIGRQAGVTNSEAVAERGRAAGRDLGADPAVAVAGMLDRATASVDAAPDDVDQGLGPALLLALTGRAPLPDGSACSDGA